MQKLGNVAMLLRYKRISFYFMKVEVLNADGGHFEANAGFSDPVCHASNSFT